MALNKDDKEFIALSLTPIKKDTESINRRLDLINGSVQRHEGQIIEALTERAKNREQQRQEFNKLKEVHDKVDCMDNSLLEYKAIKKYPRAFAFMGATFVLWIGWEILQNFVL